MYSCFGVGAAVHIVNMCHAYMVKDLKNPNLSFAPALIPLNEFSRPAYAAGVGLQYSF